MKNNSQQDTRSGQQAKWLKGDPRLRQQVQQWIPLITVLIIAGLAYVIHRLRQFADVVGDPCVAAAELAQLLTISGTIAAGLLGFVAVVLLWLGLSSWREGQFPPSMMPMVRDTRLRVGSDATVRAALLAALGLLVLAAAAFGFMRVQLLVSALTGNC